MSDNLKEQFPKLELLCNVKRRKLRHELLRVLSRDDNFRKAVREITRNTLNRNVRIGDKEKKKLTRYRRTIIALGQKGKNKRSEQRVICQTGTGIFLPIVVPLVADLLYNILKPKAQNSTTSQ